MTCRELADITGYGRSSINNWLQGRSLPSADRLGDLLIALGATRHEQHVLATRRDEIEERRADPPPPTPQLTLLPGGPRPQQLPWPNPKFTGRDGEVETLTSLLDQGGSGAGTVALIAGTAGVGKTALAIHVAHQVRGRFPDGVLYADLRGFGPDERDRLAADNVVTDFLHALGVPPAEIPANTDARAARYRSELAGKRVLVIIDNAYDTAQLLPLLPGNAACAALVTSRNPLDGLVARGADVLQLDFLARAAARQLLSRYLGPERVACEPAAVDELISISARLPLALTIIAARAVRLPHIQLGELAAELTGRALDAFDTADGSGALRETFGWSYCGVSPPARRMFRLLGLGTGPDVSVAAAASLAGLPRDQAARALDELAGAGLAEKRQAHRYALHDLLRLFAVEQAEAEETGPARADAVDRLLSCYLHSADAADRVILPRVLHVPLEPGEVPPASLCFDNGGGEGCLTEGSDGQGRAIAWFESERANLLAAAHQALDTGRDTMAWKIPAAMWGFFYLRKPWADWIHSHEAGLAAAQRSGDCYGEAWMRYSLGAAHWSLGQHEQAIGQYEASLAAWRGMDHRWGEAMTLNNLAAARAGAGQLHEALRAFRQSLRIRTRIGDTKGRIQTMINIGEAHAGLGQFALADRQLREALELCRQVGYPYGEAMTLHNLGVASQALGQSGPALRYLHEAVDLRRELGDKQGEAESLHRIGQLQRAAGNNDHARRSCLHALRIFETLHDPQAAQVRRSLTDPTTYA